MHAEPIGSAHVGLQPLDLGLQILYYGHRNPLAFRLEPRFNGTDPGLRCPLREAS